MENFIIKEICDTFNVDKELISKDTNIRQVTTCLLRMYTIIPDDEISSITGSKKPAYDHALVFDKLLNTTVFDSRIANIIDSIKSRILSDINIVDDMGEISNIISTKSNTKLFMVKKISEIINKYP